MTTSEIPRYSADVIKPPDTFIEKQATLLSQFMSRLHIDGIQVANQSVVKTPTELQGTHPRMTFGYLGGFSHDAAFTSFLASGQNDQVSTYLITATDKHSGLLADDATGSLYTDSFWRLHNNRLEHITPTEPMPLDGISMCYDGAEDIDPVLKSQYSKTTHRVIQTAADKLSTKKILTAAEVRVPGPPRKGEQVVYKYKNGGYGRDVLIADSTSPTFARELEEFRSHYPRGSVYGEERIAPPPNSKLARRLGVPEDMVDWNTREVLSLEEDPQELLTIVRFGEKNYRPVNVDLGAQYDISAELLTQEQNERSNILARQAVSAIFRSQYVEGDPHFTALPIAVDVIQDRTAGYIMEVQPFGGGMHLLPGKHNDLLASVASELVNRQVPALIKRYGQRPETPKNLRRIPPTISAENNIYVCRSTVRELQKELRVSL